MKFILNNIWIGFKIILFFLTITAILLLIVSSFTIKNFDFIFSFLITFGIFLGFLIQRFIFILPYLIIAGIKQKNVSYSILNLIFGISVLAQFVSIDQYEFLTGEIKFYDPFDPDYSWIPFLEYGVAFV
ncbi:hypothetical protein, partial [Leptospira meyeri]